MTVAGRPVGRVEDLLRFARVALRLERLELAEGVTGPEATARAIAIPGEERRLLAVGECSSEALEALAVAIAGAFEDARREAQLEDDFARFRGLVGAIPDALFVLSPSFTILDFKAAHDFQTLHPAEALIGRVLREVVPADVAAPLEAAALRALDQGGVQHAEYAIDVRGERRERDARAIRINDHEILVLIRDVTGRRALEREKDELVATLAHELRTPVTAMRGALDLVAGGVAGELSPRAVQLLEVARSNCGRLLRLISDLLDLEITRVGRLQLELEEVRFSRIVAGAIEPLRLRAIEAAVELVVRGDLDACVRADLHRVVQVLTNVLANALRFSPRESTIDITVCRTPGGVRCVVRDHGPGISAEDLGKLFTRFRQVGSDRDRAGGGTGLGLAISRALIEAHGGTIGVESKPCSGSAFWFELPGG